MKKLLLLFGIIFSQIWCQAQTHNAELIRQETNIVVKGGKLNKAFYYEIKINNRAGEKFTKISIPFSSLNKVSNIAGKIIDADGRVIKKLRKSDILQRNSISDISFYEDYFVKEFTLKHNSYPYSIIYSYQTHQNEFLYIDNWTPVLDENTPTISAVLNVSIPLDYSIKYKNQYVDDPNIDSLKGVMNYRWQTNYVDFIKPEMFSPPLSEIVPAVAIIPQKFKYEQKGSFVDWISFGDWQFELLQGLNELPNDEKNKIHALINNVKDEKEIIKILYHYLQDNTRYINITIETGGLKPYPAAYVAKNKYGDCKALTNYFKSLLDYLGIKSYYSKVFAGNTIREIDQNFPSQQFNHVILYIPQEDEAIWLDCTSDGAFKYLGTFTQNRDAFIVDHNNSHFIKTPALKPRDVTETRNIEIFWKQQLANLKFENSYKGELYERILYIEKKYNETEKDRIIHNYIVDEGFQLIDYQISTPGRDSLRVELSYQATSQHIYKQYGNDLLVANIPFSVPGFEKPEDRKFPVRIDYPIFKIDSIIYDIPSGYEIDKGIKSYSVSNKFGQYNFDIYEDAGKLIVAKNVLIYAGHYPISEYEDFYNFHKQIDEHENKTHISLYKSQ